MRISVYWTFFWTRSRSQVLIPKLWMVRHLEEVLLKKATLLATFIPTGFPIKALPLSIYLNSIKFKI